MPAAPSNRLRGWLELVRPPNLPTVPGDPIAGFLLTQVHGFTTPWTRAVPVTGAALLLYMAGLILNDCADRQEDEQTRPQRPLPSGRVNTTHAAIVAGLLAAGGLALAWMTGPAAGIVATVLLGLILAYTFVARRLPWLGLLNMGACRAASLLMGAAAAYPVSLKGPALAAAGGMLLLITAISAIALREAETMPIGIKRFGPAVVAALTLGIVFLLVGFTTPLALACAGLAIIWLVFNACRLRGTPLPPVVGSTVGDMIKSLLLVQASLCALVDGPGLKACAMLLLLWPLSAVLARGFEGS